jgi:CheY-like chemotaxis protein
MQQNNRDKCILIYEDDQEILFLCKTILKKNQYQIATRSRCEDIINDVHSIKPNLILMDLWIPEIGGEKAISLLKENPDTRHIPVLLFSANAEIKELCKKLNADGYIEKPFDINVFNETIKKIIG